MRLTNINFIIRYTPATTIFITPDKFEFVAQSGLVTEHFESKPNLVEIKDSMAVLFSQFPPAGYPKLHLTLCMFFLATPN